MILWVDTKVILVELSYRTLVKKHQRRIECREEL